MVVYLKIYNSKLDISIDKLFEILLIIHSFCIKYSLNLIHNNLFNIESSKIDANYEIININKLLDNIHKNIILLNDKTENYLIEYDISNNNLVYILLRCHIDEYNMYNTIKTYNLNSKNENYICIDFYNNDFGIYYISNQKFLDLYNNINLDLNLFINIYDDKNIEFIDKNFRDNIKIYNEKEQFNILFNAKYRILSHSSTSNLIKYIEKY